MTPLVAENSKIEWTDHTFNPWVGCTKVSVGPKGACVSCYAEAWAKRTGHPELWNGVRRRTTAANWKLPLKWHAAIPDGQRQRVFCASLADVFDNVAPDQWRTDLWELIRATPRLDWLLLTKRIGNVKAMLPADWSNSVYGYNNVWLGITVVTQEEADRDIPKLLDTPARIRFLSCEPLMEHIQIAEYLPNPLWDGIESWRSPTLHWVIVGGESGAHARSMEWDWPRSLRAECETAGVAFFMKQLSQAGRSWFKDFSAFPTDLQVREWPQSALDGEAE
jgi:protein gp37